MRFKNDRQRKAVMAKMKWNKYEGYNYLTYDNRPKDIGIGDKYTTIEFNKPVKIAGRKGKSGNIRIYKSKVIDVDRTQSGQKMVTGKGIRNILNKNVGTIKEGKQIINRYKKMYE